MTENFKFNPVILASLHEFMNEINTGNKTKLKSSMEHELRLGNVIAARLGIPFYDSENFRSLGIDKTGFSKSNMILPSTFSGVVREPFGSQSGPDVAVIINGHMLPIEVKSSTNGKPVFNSVPPKPGRVYVYINTKTYKAYGFDGCIYNNNNSLHAKLHHRLKQDAEEINNSFDLGGLTFYPRAMYNVNFPIKAHDHQFDETVLVFGWDLIDLGCVNE